MLRIAALVVRDSSTPLRFAGLDLSERAQRLARRVGIERVMVVDNDHPFAAVPVAEWLLVLPETVIIERGVLTDLLAASGTAERDAEGRSGQDAATCDLPTEEAVHRDQASVVLDAEGHSTGLMLLSFRATERVRAVPRLRSAVRRLGIETKVRGLRLGQRFVARLDIRDLNVGHVDAEIARLEAAFLHHTNGGDGEGYFTKNIRAFSVPLSRRLLRWNAITANHVTLAGFALAIFAGLSFSFGTYWAGVAGSLLYWASMVLDCSDGEVARGKLGDSKFGAWLETVTDYLSYFIVLAGIVAGDRTWDSGLCAHIDAAIVATFASAAIVLIVGYLRARVASQNPGAFDDALAADMRHGTPVQKFAVWGRQLIKRSFFAHLIVFQAAIGQLPALTEIWAYGSIAALVVVIAVQAHIIRSVRIEPLRPVITL
jgi:phosphatidylglycerophosphate synthase